MKKTMNSLEVMEFLVEKFGFEMKYNYQVTDSGKWSHVAVHHDGERLVEVFDGDAPSNWLGMRINGEQYELGDGGAARLTLLNTEEKILHEFSKLGFLPNEKTLTPCEIQYYLVDNYGFKVGDKIIDGSNNSYLIVSEFMITGIKMFTLQGVNTGSFYTQHATMINCAYTKEKQPILWTTMADGSRIVGVGERGKYVIKHRWSMRKDVELTTASHQYTLTLNNIPLPLGTQESSSIDGVIQFANAHNLS